MSNQPAQNNNNNNQQQQQPSSPFGSRFGNRPGGNQNQPAPAAPPPPPQQGGLLNRTRPGFNNPNQRSWHIQPLVKTVVRFDLKGLGDPFYRLLGHDLNPDFGDSRNVAAALEQGGEAAAETSELLNETWESYKLDGAFLVYNWNIELWRALITPPAPPQQNEDDSEDRPAQPPQNQPPLFHCIRAIDLELVINVLARARTQLLIAKAPLVLSQQYLTRSIMSDDPRLVALARATGYLEEC